MSRVSLRFAIAAVAAVLAGLGAPPDWAQDTAQLFKTNCVLCHGADGSGNTPSGKALGAKDLRSPEIQKKTDAEITDTISKGKGKMPPLGAKLKPEEIKQLVAYVRALAKK